MKNMLFFMITLFAILSCSAQHEKREPLIILLTLNSKVLQSCSINTDSTAASFGLYFHGYEDKTKRDEALKNFDPDRLAGFSNPSFAINFISMHPPKVVLEKNYTITAEEFCKGNLSTTNPTYILLEIGKRYLLWDVFTMGDE